MSLEVCAQHQFPSFSKLGRTFEPEKVCMAIAVLLDDQLGSFEVALPKKSIENLSIEVYWTMRDLSLEDCFVALRELKSKPQFGKLTENKVLAALKDYNERRMNEVQRINESKHLSEKFVNTEEKATMKSIMKRIQIPDTVNLNEFITPNQDKHGPEKK